LKIKKLHNIARFLSACNIISRQDSVEVELFSVANAEDAANQSNYRKSKLASKRKRIYSNGE
jgi:hypothetical protein